MTREKAIAASRAIDAIDGFQAFMEQVDKAVDDASEWFIMNPDFRVALYNLMEEELRRLNTELENL